MSDLPKLTVRDCELFIRYAEEYGGQARQVHISAVELKELAMYAMAALVKIEISPYPKMRTQ